MTDGFLLTRHWRDTRRGLELEYWWATDNGPIQTRHTAQEAVFFIAASKLSKARDILAELRGWRTRELDLTTREGKPVVACYFSRVALAREAEKRLTSHAIACWEADIRPPERFLMERFITAAARIGNLGEYPGATLIDPPLQPSDYRPALNLASVDIETTMDARQLYSIGVFSARTQVVFMVADMQVQRKLDDSARLVYCPSERDCLLAFLSWLESENPDGLIGWNLVQFDLWVLQRIADRLGVKLTLGRGGQKPYWREEKGEGGRRFISVPGRVMLDGIELLKAANYQFESFALDQVAAQLLGEGKLLHGAGRGEDITRLYRDNKPALARYNLKDCELVWNIFARENLLAFAVERSQLTGLLLDRIGGSVAAFEYSYLPRLHRAGFIAPNLGELKTDIVSPGGYVMDSQPGIYQHVLVLDFKSLYPSIIRTFFIDPCAFWMASLARAPSAQCVPGFNGAEFDRESAILPGMIENLWQARDAAKREQNQPLSYAIKIIMNSFYGVLGSTGCRFFDPRVASSITLRGHDIIQSSKRWLESEGLQVIYGDTDSVFVWLRGESASLSGEQATRIGQQLAAGLNQWWQEKLQDELGIDSSLEIEFETHYRKFLMPTVRGSDEGSKKRYAGLVTKGDTETLVFKGLESVRTDWTALAREFQTELYRRIFLGLDYRDFVLTSVDDLMRAQVDDQLVYRKRLRRRLDEYQKNIPPHVQAARKQRDWGLGVCRRGDWVSYVITQNGAEPAEGRRSAIDYEHYRERQLAPVADAILYFLGDSLAAITDQQISLF
ncbi:DNA polymerase II [Gilvimarinus xylanilyticus]|uniref:DNA polymerase n=1 Tax=Gilvimarinus xylanilyticus TaxID=2944139 RepID=A0A9X2HUA1_9GAMM|nr:DNA polymerase II [Gilvimarinus xylanilyticus]MCP8897754.1 DNA polymerase II [Gilvimarinus xylanilyticus]